TTAEVRRLQSELDRVVRENQQLVVERDQTAERLQAAERNLAENQKKDSGNVLFQLPEGAFDGAKLTSEGRDRLTLLSNMAAIIPAGVIQIQMPFADDSGDAAVKEFLSAAGVSQDRVTLVRK